MPAPEPGDRRLLALVDAATARAASAAGPHLACHAGCTPCCFGPFSITRLDAWRLGRGLTALGATDPARARAVRARARAAVEVQTPGFAAGEAGVLRTEADERRLHAAFADAPCPALDPATGACLLYEWRPLACRTHGPPLRIAGDRLPPCPHCFRDATPAEVEAARVDLDVEGLEAALIAAVEAEPGRRARTTVAFALARHRAPAVDQSTA